MLRQLSFTALGFVAAQFGSLDAYAQRAVTPQGGTPPISRTETRPNLGAGAYRSNQDRSVRSATSSDTGVRSTATGSRIGARAGSRVGFGATFDDGVINDLIIDQVTAGSPAALAGLQAGDTIVSINDRRFRDQQQASTFLRGFTGDSLNLTLLRNGALVDVTANTARNANASNANSTANARALANSNSNTTSIAQHDFGINDAMGFGMRLGAADDGIVVREVARNSLAADTGIRAGDRIVSLGGQNISDAAAVNQVLSGIGRDPTLDVVVARDGQPVDLSANLARYTGYYSTVDHDRGGTVDTTSATRQFGNANLEGFQTTLGATFSRDANGNMIVSRISPNSYASELGLQRGDVLFGSNGQPITTSQGLMQFFSGTRPGTEFGVDVWREGQQMALNGNFDQSFYNELSAFSTVDGQIEEKSTTGSTARIGTNQQPNRTAMRDGATQSGASRFDDGSNSQFNSRDNAVRPDAFRDSQVNDGANNDGAANTNTRQFPRSASGNPYRRPGTFGNAGNDQEQNGGNRERGLNQRPLNQGQMDRRDNQGGVFNNGQQNTNGANASNGQSTRIDTPEAQGQLNAVEELRESFQRGQAAGQGQNPGIAGQQQQRPGSLGNRPRTGGNLGTGINPQGQGAAAGQRAAGQVRGGASATGGTRGGATGGAVRGGASGGGAAGAGAGGGRR